MAAGRRSKKQCWPTGDQQLNGEFTIIKIGFKLFKHEILGFKHDWHILTIKSWVFFCDRWLLMVDFSAGNYITCFIADVNWHIVGKGMIESFESFSSGSCKIRPDFFEHWLRSSIQRVGVPKFDPNPSTGWNNDLYPVQDFQTINKNSLLGENCVCHIHSNFRGTLPNRDIVGDFMYYFRP